MKEDLDHDGGGDADADDIAASIVLPAGLAFATPDAGAGSMSRVTADVIGDYLTEINVTSPTGIQEIGRFDGISIEALIWAAIERRFAETRD